MIKLKVFNKKRMTLLTKLSSFILNSLCYKSFFKFLNEEFQIHVKNVVLVKLNTMLKIIYKFPSSVGPLMPKLKVMSLYLIYNF